MFNQHYRVRFAPSPTGSLHVGGARTALFNFLLSRKHKGAFVLRVEDTDLLRNTNTALAEQLRDLKWLGIDWDEGVSQFNAPDIGPFGPYRQTQRLEIYLKLAEDLVKNGKAYYVNSNEDHGAASLATPLRKAIKLKIPTNKQYEFNDLIRGPIKINTNTLDDFIIIRSNGLPVYNFSNPIDDHLMKITHVYRAEEHLYNTFKQLLVYEALNFKVPLFGHLSLILGQDKQKLSKRHGAVSCDVYREKGILPEALINYLSLLGWSPKNDLEFFKIEDLIEKFDAAGFNAAPTIFDEKKLNWFNTLHIRNLSDVALYERVIAFDNSVTLNSDKTFLIKLISVIKPVATNLEMIANLLKRFNEDLFEIKSETLLKFDITVLKIVISLWNKALSKTDNTFISESQFLQIIEEISKESRHSGKNLYQSLRIAILGTPSGLDLKKVVPLIKLESLKRRAVETLNQIDRMS